MRVETRIRATGVAGCLLGASLVAVGAATVTTSPARAVPAFAEQTGQACAACHVGGFGPQLTPFGRAFKLGGYTLRVKNNIPISAMAVASVTSTKRPQVPPPPGFSSNDNAAFDQGSVFLAGGVGSHFGGFAQFTYDGVGKAWSWDNLDLRAVNTGKIGGKDLVYGLSLNNSPSVQDVWNTLPAWGYPYTSSGLAPSPANAPLVAGGLAQNVVGLTGYAWLDSKFYVEAGGYSSPRAGTLRRLGADPSSPGDIRGIAPYARVAFEDNLAGGTFELGGFFLNADIRPGRDRSTNLTDRYTDTGIDASWLRALGSDTVTVNARYTHENRALDASCSLGMTDGSIPAGAIADCRNGSLSELRADASYYWHNKIGATVGAFDLSGRSNPSLYPDSRTASPDSTGITMQIDGTPWGGSHHSPLGPRFNMRVGVQYTAYTRFDGARLNYDGAGAKASDNNTLRLFTWIAF